MVIVDGKVKYKFGEVDLNIAYNFKGLKVSNCNCKTYYSEYIPELIETTKDEVDKQHKQKKSSYNLLDMMLFAWDELTNKLRRFL